jgi:hypothetical protein
VFNQRLDRRSICHFFLPAARNDRYHNHTGGSQTDTDAVENAALQNNPWRGKKKSAEDRGFN